MNIAQLHQKCIIFYVKPEIRQEAGEIFFSMAVLTGVPCLLRCSRLWAVCCVFFA